MIPPAAGAAAFRGTSGPVASGGGTIRTSAVPAALRTMRAIRGSAPSASTIKTSAVFQSGSGGGGVSPAPAPLTEQQSFATRTAGGIPVWMLAVGGLAIAGAGYFFFVRKG